jgi:hypothetical protein
MSQPENEENEMTTMMKTQRVARIAFVATILIALSGCAALTSQSDDYYFSAVGHPSGDTLTVHFVNTVTGQPITDAQLFALHKEYRPAKGAPQIVDQRIPLNPNGRGDYTYESRDVQAGALIAVAAQVQGHDSLIYGIVRVPD